MGPLELALAIFALLLTPGPTNTLLFLAGSERGLAGAARLIPVELSGYLATVIPLTWIGSEVLQAWPGLRPAIAMLAGLWVAWLAVRLWHLPRPGTAAHRHVTAADVFVTTLLNPKALIFGLVLLPAATLAQVAANIGQFALQVTVVALLWAAGGAAVARQAGSGRGVVILRRAASVWLGIVSAGLLARGLGA